MDEIILGLKATIIEIRNDRCDNMNIDILNNTIILLQSQQQTIEKLKSENDWISVDDEIPETYQDEYYGRRHSVPVMIYDNYGNPVIVKWDSSACGWVNSNFSDGYRSVDYDYTATHWQPLPEPPKDKSE